MKKSILVTFLVFSLISSVFASDYVIAAEKFGYTKGQTSNAVTDATSELLPQEILSNISSQLMRSVLPDEQLDRLRYKSRQERYSLFLQLSSEYQKRDSLVLNDYSEKELKKAIQNQSKTIKEIEEKIQKNIDEQKKAESEMEEKLSKFENGTYTLDTQSKSELEKYSSLLKNMFVKNESLVSIEGIKFYNNDNTALYVANEVSKKAGYQSQLFEKDIVNANINALITGKITSYGNYCSVTVKTFTYPGSKLIGTLTEIGSKNELDFICDNISRQLIPILTNSMKVSLSFEIEPSNAPYQIFVDDLLQENIEENLILDSGVHKLQFVADGYESVSAKYFFDGNESYKINVFLKPAEITNLRLTLLNPVPGTIYANSIPGLEDENLVSEIQINGSTVLGNFTDINGHTTFYYIPANKMVSDELLYIKVSTKNKDEIIDTRRKWMYAGYSALMVSLIPTFYTNGERQKYASLYNNKLGDYKTAKNWENAWLACTAVSITAGVVWGIELVRYLMAANTVLPQTPKADKNGALAEKQQKNIEKAKIKAEKERKKLEAQAEKQRQKDIKAGLISEDENQTDENAETETETEDDELKSELETDSENIENTEIKTENEPSEKEGV